MTEYLLGYRKKVWVLLFSSFIYAIGGFSQEVHFSADQLFNRGNASFQDKKFGDAVYHYEKALILDPNSNDILVNLELAKERLDSDIIDLDAFFLADWWMNLSNVGTPGIWKLVSLFFLFLVVGLMYFYWFKDLQWRPRKIYGAVGVLSALFLISILAGKTRSDHIFKNPYAIVNAQGENLYLAPDEVSEKVKEVTDGVKVKVLDESGDWYKVSAMNSEQGWIKKSELRLLSF